MKKMLFVGDAEGGLKMSDIRFYIPNGETIPTDLRLYVGDVYVQYERIFASSGYFSGFTFRVALDDEKKAMEIVKEIVQKMMWEHDESRHGVSWRTLSIDIVPQDERYRSGTMIEWKYRVRDSY